LPPHLNPLPSGERDRVREKGFQGSVSPEYLDKIGRIE